MYNQTSGAALNLFSLLLKVGKWKLNHVIKYLAIRFVQHVCPTINSTQTSKCLEKKLKKMISQLVVFSLLPENLINKLNKNNNYQPKLEKWGGGK